VDEHLEGLERTSKGPFRKIFSVVNIHQQPQAGLSDSKLAAQQDKYNFVISIASVSCWEDCTEEKCHNDSEQITSKIQDVKTKKNSRMGQAAKCPMPTAYRQLALAVF